VTSGKASAEPRFARADRPPEPGPRPDDGARLAGEIALAIREEIPAFATIDDEEVRRLADWDIRHSRAAVRERRAPTREELDASAAVTVALARAGVPLDAINQSRRLAARRILDAWRERESDADDLHRLWSWTDAITDTAATAYRQVEAEAGRREDDQRTWFLRRLLDGKLSRAEVESRAAAYGLLPGARYTALRGRPSPEADARQLQRAVEVSAGTEHGGALVALVDGDVWGVASQPPTIEAGQGIVGLGTSVELSAADSSFRLAGRALETASAFGLEGVVSIDELSLRPVIVSEDQLGDRLVRRYLEPLRELGEFGATLERTVQEYLASGMRIEDSAKALIIHPNTLRHRIDRFQQITGADLRRTEDLIEVWWALERRRVS
jgi:PucR-like helix-turn-helix protein